MTATFSAIDYAVFIGTLAISMLIGVYYAFCKKQQTNEELLVGGRSMNIVPIALSLLATYMSAILVLGFAGEIYSYGTLISEMIIGCFFYIPLGGFLFLPTLYGLKLTSAYEYLGLRFKSQIITYIATVTFIVQIVLYMGVVLYAPSLALHSMVGFDVWVSIIAIGGCAGIYTAIGGLQAVVWTDVFQILMMFAGMFAIIIQGSINVGGITNAFNIANDHGRINFLNFTVDPFTRLTSLNIFFGQGIFWLSAYGCHQTTVQRYCSMPTLKKAFTALIFTAPLVAFTMSLAVLTGCDPLTLGFIKRNDEIAPHFVVEFLSPTSGLMGLFIACLFSGSLSTVSSGLNSLAAVTWQDFFTKIRYFRELNEGQQGFVTKVIGLFYGGVTIGMGFVAGNLGGVLPAAIVVNGAVVGPLLGVFILGVLIPFINKYGAILGMLIAHALTLWISFGGLYYNKKSPPLSFGIENCSNETLSRVVGNLSDVYYRAENPPKPLPSPDWPDKLYTISYTLYPLIGTLTTVIVGCIVSLVTGPSRLTKDQEQYIHPLIVKLSKIICGKSKSNKKRETLSMEMHSKYYSHNEFDPKSTEFHLHNPYLQPNQHFTNGNGHGNGKHRSPRKPNHKYNPNMRSYDNSGFSHN